MKHIKEELFQLQDINYRDFQMKLIPNNHSIKMIGVRTPELRKIAKTLVKENQYHQFIKELPHEYFDENQLHGFIISEIKNYEDCISYLNKFLPYIDNWATCDQTRPSIFKKHHKEVIKEIKKWINSKDTYTIRFGIGILMNYYLDNNFKKEYLKWVVKIKSKEYYVNMMRAWFFATSLSKQYESTIPILEKYELDKWTHNKTIQKAVESYRISKDQKDILKRLKR